MARCWCRVMAGRVGASLVVVDGGQGGCKPVMSGLAHCACTGVAPTVAGACRASSGVAGGAAGVCCSAVPAPMPAGVRA